MSRKLIALDLALLALLIWAGLGLRSLWISAKRREAEGLRKKPQAVAVSPLAPLPPSPAVVPSKYKEIADKFLLSKDRNPDVPVEPPPPPPPEKPMPPLPVYHGLMNLGDGPIAFLSKTAGSTYETVHPGESIGDFKLLSVNTKEIEFEWNGKKVRRAVDELTDNSQNTADQQQAAAAGRPANAPVAPPPPQEPPSAKGPGETNQFGTASCQPNDSTPDGTIRDGYRKVHRQTPFGNICLWESVGGK